MPDVTIISKADLRETVADWLLTPTGNLLQKYQLPNYVKVALMSDRLSAPEEILPDPDSTDRRGWWGDFEAKEIWNGWPIGCKNWLLTRAKILEIASYEGDTVIRAENYTREALQPLLSMKIASKIVVVAQRIGRERIDVAVTIYRRNDTEPDVALLFQDLWNELKIEITSNPYGVTP
jgi:phage gp46-like protein